MSKKFAKTIEELEAKAIMWWPSHLSALEEKSSIIPLLLRSQERFLSLLCLIDGDTEKIFSVIRAAKFPSNLFVKHLIVLSDFGGEQLQRLNRQFSSVFSKKDGKYFFEYAWEGKKYEYAFKKLPLRRTLNNAVLSADGKGLLVDDLLDETQEDVIAILLFGSACLDETAAETLSKCEVGSLLGRKVELEKYTKEKYIWVSRITGGAQANALGQVAQTFVVESLRAKLGRGYSVQRNGSISVGGNQKDIPFDVVVTKGRKAVGVEVTFQVTTNSTIERKSGQAKARFDLMHGLGHRIAYVVDGAGNFQRKSAISNICKYSDCTVAYSESEFDTLAEFIKDSL